MNLNIVVSEDDDVNGGMRVVAAFTDKDRALDWYSRLPNVSVHSVEVDSSAELRQFEKELEG